MPSITRRLTGRLTPALVAVVILASPCAAQSMEGCDSDSTYALLDFWVGSWSVYVGRASRASCAAPTAG